MRDAYWDTISKPFSQAGAAAFFTTHEGQTRRHAQGEPPVDCEHEGENAAAGTEWQSRSGSPWARYTSTRRRCA